MIRRFISCALALAAVACSGAKIGDLNGAPLNPELYRTQIAAIDAVVFEDGPLGEQGRDQASASLQRLSELVVGSAKSSIAKTLGNEMATLASGVKRTSTTAPLRGSQLQRQWLRIRSSVFDDAAWFRRSSADPIDEHR